VNNHSQLHKDPVVSIASDPARPELLFICTPHEMAIVSRTEVHLWRFSVPLLKSSITLIGPSCPELNMWQAVAGKALVKRKKRKTYTAAERQEVRAGFLFDLTFCVRIPPQGVRSAGTAWCDRALLTPAGAGGDVARGRDVWRELSRDPQIQADALSRLSG
jgi:hypothetical protein